MFLYTRILALFSSKPYDSPSLGDEGQTEDMDLSPHLTNTSLQLHTGEESVRLLEELNGCTILSGSKENSRTFTEGDIANILQQMATALAETFKAALESPVHFQVGTFFRTACIYLNLVSPSHCQTLLNYTALIFWSPISPRASSEFSSLRSTQSQQ